MSQHLIIFTRYPEAGKAKTRLIPALGPEGAAELHCQMAEHTLAQARSLQARLPTSVEIQFVGGSAEQMQGWLGEDLHYQPQSAGDLGDRMAQAFQSAFAAGAVAAIVIGTDCPDLDAMLSKPSSSPMPGSRFSLFPMSLASRCALSTPSLRHSRIVLFSS